MNTSALAYPGCDHRCFSACSWRPYCVKSSFSRFSSPSQRCRGGLPRAWAEPCSRSPWCSPTRFTPRQHTQPQFRITTLWISTGRSIGGEWVIRYFLPHF